MSKKEQECPKCLGEKVIFNGKIKDYGQCALCKGTGTVAPSIINDDFDDDLIEDWDTDLEELDLNDSDTDDE